MSAGNYQIADVRKRIRNAKPLKSFVERWLQELERDGQIATTTGAADDTATDARPEQG
jgi:hypothetical protein